MHKIKLILWREFITRIRKKSFIVMTIAGPILMAILMIIPIWISLKDVDLQLVQVIDETYAFRDEFNNGATIRFDYSDENIVNAKFNFYDTKYTSLLYIPENAYSATGGIRLFHKKQPSQRTLNYINNVINDVIERDRIKLKYMISKEELIALKPKVNVMTINLDETGKEEKTHAILSMILGFGGAILIYFFIFLHGVQVMRGVIEEKVSRIVEVIISSVTPFELMLGKILGIAMVGLLQFILWIIFTAAIVGIAQQFIPDNLKKQINSAQQMEEFMPDAPAEDKSEEKSATMIKKIYQNISLINFPLILFSFLFYFLGGYLLYGAMFAAIGSAVDSEADTQQFMLPVTAPLILAFVLAQTVIANPDGAMAFWLSIIPFTSPIIMMVRIPFGVGVNEMLLSMGILVVSFIAVTWLAGKIYRTGILMHGKKASYKELWKWLFYKV